VERRDERRELSSRGSRDCVRADFGQQVADTGKAEQSAGRYADVDLLPRSGLLSPPEFEELESERLNLCEHPEERWLIR
jgi:hypothetical protein